MALPTNNGATLAELVRLIVQAEDQTGGDDSYVVAASSDRSDYAPAPGRVFEESDGTAVYIGTGSGWVDASTLTLISPGTTHSQRGAPTTDDLADGERLVYVSNGSDGNAAGDLVSARNNSGSIVDQVVAAASGDA